MSSITRLCKRIDATRAALSSELFKAMDNAARAAHIHNMCFGLTTTCHHAGEEVDTPDTILDLEEIYCDYVHQGGFQCLWDQDKGWH